MSDLQALQERCLNDSRAWFPDVHRTDHDALVHFALGLAGEVGELVNIVKKVNRGDAAITDPPVRASLAHECADVAIYLMDVASMLGLDLATCIEDKRAVLIERWGQP